MPNKSEIQFLLDCKIEKQIFSIIKQPKQCPLLVFEASWILLNITVGSQEQIQQIINIGALDLLDKLLQSDQLQIQNNAAWAIGNIALENLEFRDLLLDRGFSQIIATQILKQWKKESKFSETKVWALSTLCIGKVKPKLEYIFGAIEILSVIIKNCFEKETLKYALEALRNIIVKHDNDQCNQQVIQTYVVPQLVKLLDHKETKIAQHALEIIGEISSGSEENTGCILVQPIEFDKLLQKQKKIFVQQVCWVLSNLTAGTIQQMHSVIYNEKIMNQLAKLIHHSREYIQKEIGWILSNALDSCTENDAQYLADKGIAEWLSKLLYQDDQSIKVVLQGIINFLQIGIQLKDKNNGKNPFLDYFLKIFYFENRIKHLSNNENQDIAHRAQDVLKYIQD